MIQITMINFNLYSKVSTQVAHVDTMSVVYLIDLEKLEYVKSKNITPVL
jgi:hypothetical protein